MKREISFRIPTVCRNDRIVSVDFVRQTDGYMTLVIESYNSDFKVGAKNWLLARDLFPYRERVRSGHAIAVVNKFGGLGISSYREGDEIPFDETLGTLLALADSFGVKQEMMKDIGMV